MAKELKIKNEINVRSIVISTLLEKYYIVVKTLEAVSDAEAREKLIKIKCDIEECIKRL